MAYRKLAVAIGNSNGAASHEAAAAKKAFLGRDRLPDIERELASAYYYGTTNDRDKEAAAYRSALGIDPDNDIALNNLALLLNRERHWAEAESLAAHALTLGSSVLDFDKMVLAQILQGKDSEAAATVARATKAVPPGSPTLLDFNSWLALARRDYGGARRFQMQLREQQRSSPTWQMRTSMSLARLAETQGRLAESAQHLRDYMAEADGRGLPQEYISAATDLGLLEVRYRSRPAEALAIVQGALARHPLDSMAAPDRPYLQLARLYAEAGKVDLATRTMRELKAAGPPDESGPVDPLLAYGRVAEAEGRVQDAVIAYHRVYDHAGLCGTCGLYELADLYDRQGQADSARVFHQRLVDEPTAFGHLVEDHYGLAPTYKRLGELYEAKGDRKRAAEYYNRFVELWKNADAELQPGVKEVRGRLARLAQEPGT